MVQDNGVQLPFIRNRPVKMLSLYNLKNWAHFIFDYALTPHHIPMLEDADKLSKVIQV